MKTIKISSVILVSILLSYNFVYGQNENKPIKDTIHAFQDLKTEIIIALDEYENIGEMIETDFKNLTELLVKSNGAFLMDDDVQKLTYIPEKSLNFEPLSPIRKIVMDKNEPISYMFNYQCNIKRDEYFLQINSFDQEYLFSEETIKRVKELISSTDSMQGKFSSNYYYEISDGKVNYREDLHKITDPYDAIEMRLGTGVSLIKNKPITDISGEIGLTFSNKGIHKNQYYLSGNYFFEFDDNQSILPSSFLNIGYRRNLSNDPEKSNWFGVEVGYLISTKGSIFDANTFKLATNWSIGKNVYVSTQLLFSDGFKKLYPGIRIGFGL